MKALSIKQPWAAIILRGLKNVENRTWATNYRGPLLIHAGKNLDLSAVQKHERLSPDELGCILGMIQLVDCTKAQSSIWHENGYYGWYLRWPVIFKYPIPYRGQLRLFEVPDELLKEVPDA